MKRVLILNLLLMLGQSVYAQDAPNPQQEIERHPGDIDGAVGHLGKMLQESYRNDYFADFTAARISRPNESAHFAATRILALQRMGKLSVHSPAVKRAFAYEFLTTYLDQARLHEALALYERIAVANTDDPHWRLFRARCARLMDLPETLQLYEQVAVDMTGAPPTDDVRKLWEANREEFDLPPYTKEAWAKHTTTFVYDAKGPDFPNSPPISGSPFPLIDVAGVVGSEAATWATALDASPQTHAKALDDIIGQAGKYGELPWLDGRGFLNTGRALSSHLLGKPAGELAALRELQETGFQKAVAKAADATEPLTLFRRYPWSQSAQRLLLESARQALFAGESQGAFRSFRDVLRHAAAGDLLAQAQVGLWVSLAQFAEPEALTRAFEGVDSDATWPWNGKHVKTEVIRQQLARESAELQSPSLASLTPHTVHLPPVPLSGSSVFSIDMQRDGDQLLVSSERMLLMYNATSPATPLWSHTRRLQSQEPGAKYVLPRFVDKQIVTRWAGGRQSDNPLVALHRADGAIVSKGDPHGSYSRYRYKTIGSPATIDDKVYAVQFQQPYLSIYGHPEHRGWGDVTLSCFAKRDLTHQWTHTYATAQTNGTPNRKRFNSVLPRISQGAVYFCSNDGHVIRADSRDGEMEWIHFFRPVIDPHHHSPQKPSPWCLGSAPVVTGDKVICMPKFTGRLFALDKETGRRIWTVPMLRGHEVLGAYEDQVLVVGANSIYAVDTNTGEMRWGRPIAPQYADGFQLPRAQLIGSSVYCGTKNTLYRFDARNGSLLESRDWEMGEECPMSFLIDGAELYAISDLPLRDAIRERQLIDYQTIIAPAGQIVPHWDQPNKLPDGSLLIWRDGMLMRIKDSKLIWSRFLSNDHIYGSRMSARNNQVLMSWSGTSAVHDATTGQLLSMQQSRAPQIIKIGGK